MATFQLFHKNFTNIPCDFEMTIGGIKAMLTKGTGRRESATFQWKQYPEVYTRLQFLLKYKDGVYTWLQAEEEVDAEEDITAIDDISHFPAIYYVIKDLSGLSQRMDHIVCVNRLFGWDPIDFLECEDFQLISGSALTHPDRYTTNDSLVIRVYVEPPALARRVFSYEGFLNWSMDNFSKRKRKELLGLFDEESPYFYTGTRGYRVRVLLRSVGNTLRVFVYFCAGEFDEELPASFPHCTTVTLLHRSDPERHVVKRVRHNVRDRPFYAVDVAIDHQVEELIEEDTLFYSVSVRPTLLPPPN